MTKLAAAELKLLAELTWELGTALEAGSNVSLTPYLARWPNDHTRSRLAEELVRCETGQLGLSVVDVASRIVECGQSLQAPESRLSLLRGVYSDAIEQGHSPAIDKFLELGFSADQLQLRA